MAATADADEDERWMRVAHEAALQAFVRGDWPTGAVIVKGGLGLATGRNRQVSGRDPTLHAETDAVHQAVAAHGPQALQGATLYSTMEPCPMCAAALRLAGIGRVVSSLRMAQLGRRDLGRYSIEAFMDLVGWQPELRFGVLEQDCLALRTRWGGDARLDTESAP